MPCICIGLIDDLDTSRFQEGLGPSTFFIECTLISLCMFSLSFFVFLRRLYKDGFTSLLYRIPDRFFLPKLVHQRDTMSSPPPAKYSTFAYQTPGQIISAGIVLPIVGIIVTGLRFWARNAQQKGAQGIDDWLMVPILVGHDCFFELDETVLKSSPAG